MSSRPITECAHACIRHAVAASILLVASSLLAACSDREPTNAYKLTHYDIESGTSVVLQEDRNPYTPYLLELADCAELDFENQKTGSAAESADRESAKGYWPSVNIPDSSRCIRLLSRRGALSEVDLALDDSTLSRELISRVFNAVRHGYSSWQNPLIRPRWASPFDVCVLMNRSDLVAVLLNHGHPFERILGCPCQSDSSDATVNTEVLGALGVESPLLERFHDGARLLFCAFVSRHTMQDGGYGFLLCEITTRKRTPPELQVLEVRSWTFEEASLLFDKFYQREPLESRISQ